MQKDVRVFKLVNGDDIVAKISHEATQYEPQWEVTEALRMVITPQGLLFMEWIPFSPDESFTIKDGDVMLTCTPSADVLDTHTKQFSKIIQPSEKEKKIIMPS